MSQLTTIKLGGRLGREFGKEFKLDVHTPAEAILALCSIKPDFKRELAESGGRGVDYRVRVQDEDLSEQDLHRVVKGKTLRLSPVVRGSKSGFFQVILGAALIAASFYTGGLATAGYVTTATASTLGSAAFAMGFAMAIGGVTQMLTPQSKGLGTADAVENGASYNFNGPVNTTRQGAPVPLAYGEVITGSATVSAGIYSEDQA